MTVTEIEPGKRQTGEEQDDEFDPAASTGEDDTEGEGGEVERVAEVVTPPMQVPLPGLLESMTTDAGGRQPDRSEIRLLGGKMPINGSFSKGAEFDVLVRVKVTGVLLQDTVDAFGVEEGTTRRHMARMLSVKRVNLPSSAPAEK